MNRETMTKKVNTSLINQIKSKGYITAVDMLIDIGVLTQQNYKKWRFGEVDYLERLCTCNLNQLTYMMKLMREFANNQNLTPSYTVYKSWGKGKKLLRFSKSNDKIIEKNYATHYMKKVR